MTASFKSAAKHLFHWAGGVSAVRFRYRKGLRILMYHRFECESHVLERQCAHLARYYRVLSLTDATRCLQNGDDLPPNALSITVDDGHQDFYPVAYPIFRRHGIPATLYLTTDYLDGKGWLWFDLIDYLFESTSASSLEFENQVLPLASDGMKQSAAWVVKQAALRITNQNRLHLMDQLPRLLKVDPPALPLKRWAPLTWAEVREMASHGFEFGAHTRTHPILSSLAGEDLIREEIEGSKRRIEQELNSDVNHFCYPNGTSADFTEQAVERVRRAGFRTAVTTEAGVNRPGGSLFLLKRIGADPDIDPYYFERRVAGLGLG